VKIATWNVNSIKARLPNVLDWVGKISPDVLCLQEIKCQTPDFPLLAFEEIGYRGVVHGQKSYNGVALLSKLPIDDPLTGLPGDSSDEQARYVEATIDNKVRVGCIYLPNGNPVDSEKYPYKLRWMDRLTEHARRLLSQEMPVVLAGDYNIIPHAADCYDPAGWSDDALFRLQSRLKFQEFAALGFTDAFRALNAGVAYSFWDYQGGAWQGGKGIRIDHLMLSPQAADCLDASEIDPGPRGKQKASDHTPVWCSLAA